MPDWERMYREAEAKADHYLGTLNRIHQSAVKTETGLLFADPIKTLIEVAIRTGPRRQSNGAEEESK